MESNINNHKKVFISGPITNNPNYVDCFKSAELLLEADGKKVINPARDIIKDKNKQWEEYIVESLHLLDKCDCILMLKGWENSAGARLELQWARYTHKEIRFQCGDNYD